MSGHLFNHHQSFPIRSWVDLPHVCETSNWLKLDFRSCQNCICPLLTSSTLRFGILIIPGTFHPRRCPLFSPRCPASKQFPLNSNPLISLDLAATGKVRLHQNVLSSPL